MRRERLPFRTLYRNTLIGFGDQHAAVYRLDTISYPYLPRAEKEAWLARLARFAYESTGDFSVYRVCRSYPAADYVRQGAALLDARHQDPEVWREFLGGHQRHLSAMAAFVPEVYLVVGLRPRPPAGRFLEPLQRAPRRLLPIPGKELSQLVADEERVRRLVSTTLPIRRATTLEVQWLLRRAALRGLPEPQLDANWTPTMVRIEDEKGTARYEPRKTELYRHLVPPLERRRHVEVETEHGTSYQVMLAVGAMPDTTECPGNAELLYAPLESVGFPVDAVVHVRRISNKQALKAVHNKVIDADNIWEEAVIGGHGPLSYLPGENREMARELEAYLQDPARPPLLDTAISLAVGALNAEGLDARVDELRQRFGTVALERPFGLQVGLFRDLLPRPDTGTVRNYASVFTIEQFGALMPHGVHHAGSSRGVYLARTVTGSGRPVKIDLTEPSRTNRPPSILLAGAQGSGKTFTAQLLALFAERRGSLVVDVDPKPDHHLDDLPELAGRVHVIEISGEERYRGQLDPFLVAPLSLREDIAADYLTELLPACPPAWETQIRKQVKDVTRRTNATCVRVLEGLLASTDRDARRAGEALAVWADSGIGRLGFAKSNGAAAVIQARMPVTTIRTPALVLPDAGVARADYDAQERMSVATLKLIAAYAMQLVKADRSHHKMLVFDEAWFLLENASGRRLVDRLNRTLRAEFGSVVFATQTVSDVEAIEKLVGQRFVFGVESEDEAKAVLRLIGLDPDDRGLVQRVLRFRRGRVLIRDLHGQVAESQVDPVYPHLLPILSTTPTEHQAAV